MKHDNCTMADGIAHGTLYLLDEVRPVGEEEKAAHLMFPSAETPMETIRMAQSVFDIPAGTKFEVKKILKRELGATWVEDEGILIAPEPLFPMAFHSQAMAYIRRIRNANKKEFAARYYYWMCQGSPEGQEPAHTGLTLMGAQAVWLHLGELGRKLKP